MENGRYLPTGENGTFEFVPTPKKYILSLVFTGCIIKHFGPFDSYSDAFDFELAYEDKFDENFESANIATLNQPTLPH